LFDTNANMAGVSESDPKAYKKTPKKRGPTYWVGMASSKTKPTKIIDWEKRKHAARCFVLSVSQEMNTVINAEAAYTGTVSKFALLPLKPRELIMVGRNRLNPVVDALMPNQKTAFVYNLHSFKTS